ncbi:MAG: DUF1501 domain-containing protein [Planctomycetota bacterium]|nr:DUF1501 domain-containing protein [Planctomycetota bacterium]
MASVTPNRRQLLQAGMLGSVGLTLPDLLRHEARAKPRHDAPSVVILWMRGGPSQHDMWDPKPDAPAEIRGEFGSITTSVPGVRLTEHLPLSARVMHKFSLIRSLHHRPEDGNVGHSDADQICFTGYKAGSQPDVNVMPSCGSWAARFLGGIDPGLPAYVMVPKLLPGADAAWLGSACRPFETKSDPAGKTPFKVPNLTLSARPGAPTADEGKALVNAFDRPPTTTQADSFGRFQQQALDLLRGDRARKAFDLNAEPASLREAYGHMPDFDPKDPERCGCPNWAQRMLLAARLVEAGVRLVTVDLRWWDFHKKGFESQKLGFLPRFDRAYTAFLADLERRGVLDTTLVVAWGEIGRTPVVNANAGRDHWPYVMSAALAGGGVRGGRVVGSSDAKGAHPKDNPKLVHDVLATIYRHLGIDTTATALDHTGRPHPVLQQGKPIDELF